MSRHEDEAGILIAQDPRSQATKACRMDMMHLGTRDMRQGLALYGRSMELLQVGLWLPFIWTKTCSVDVDCASSKKASAFLTRYLVLRWINISPSI